MKLSVSALSANILQATSIDELAVLRKTMVDNAFEHAYLFYRHPFEEMVAVNRLTELFIRKVISFCEEATCQSGLVRPHATYDFFLVGSGGRQEQTLASDQDHGIVYELTEEQCTEETQAYFLELGARITSELTKLGFPPCEGEVLCNHAKWCRSELAWSQEIEKWLDSAQWEDIRYLLILSDLRPIYGTGTLTVRLRNHILSQLRQRDHLASRLLENTLRHKILLGVFGQFLKEPYGEHAGEIDIKYGAYIPMVNGIRCLSLLVGITETSTVARIKALEKQGVLSPSQAKSWGDAFVFFVGLRERCEIEKSSDGLYSSQGMFDPNQLSKDEVQQLKRFLKIGKTLQRFVQQFVERKQG